MLKKATVRTRPAPARQDAPFCRQGRSERGSEEVHTALRVVRSPLQIVLANGKVPPALPTSEELLLKSEPLNAARTPLADFFSILLVSSLLLDNDLSSLRIQADPIAFLEPGGNARHIRNCRQSVFTSNDRPV